MADNARARAIVLRFIGLSFAVIGDIEGVDTPLPP
jgi:hypothetical protein